MLFKHTTRYIFKHNVWLMLAICALLFIMSMLFFCLTSLNINMNKALSQFEQLQQEHFQIIPKQNEQPDIPNTLLELQQIKYITDNDIYYKVLSQNEEINKAYYTEGRKANTVDEIVIDVQSANRLNLTVNDEYHLLDKSYKISGIASFPGQIKPNMQTLGYKNYYPDQSVLVELNDKAYGELTAVEQQYYSGIWRDERQQEQLINDDLYILVKYAKDNVEINSLPIKISMNQMTAGISVAVLMSIVFIMMFMLIYKMIKDNQEVYGVLKGIGYSNQAIGISFIPIILMINIPIIVAYIASEWLANPLFQLMNNDLIVPNIQNSSNLLILLLSLLIMTFVMSMFSGMIIVKLLRRDPIALIRGNGIERTGKIQQLVLKMMTRKHELYNLRNKFMLRNPFILGLMLFSGFALTVQLLLSFAMFEIPKHMTKSYEEQLLYDYDVKFIEPSVVEPSPDYIAYTTRSMTLNEGTSSEAVQVIITDSIKLHSLLQFYDYQSNDNITAQMNNGIIVSKWFAHKHELKVGDHIKLEDKTGSFTLAISGIHKGLQGSEMYTTQSYLASVTDEPASIYDGVFVNGKYEALLQASMIGVVTDQQEVLKVVEQSTEQYHWIGWLLLIIGLVLSSILLIIALYVMLQHNRQQIILFKAIGYTNTEISIISIQGYLLPIYMGSFIAMPYFLILGNLLFGMISRESTLYIAMDIKGPYIFYCVLLITTFFYLIAAFFIRSLSKFKQFSLLMN